MRYQQLKFAPADYVPRIHGYCRVSHKRQHDRGNSVQDQRARITQYVELRKLDSTDPSFQRAVFHRFWAEPKAQSAYLRELRQRPAGAKMIQDLQPGDFIIVDKLDRMFRSTIDFLASRRYFAEMGVSMHFVNFMGMSVDTASLGGGMLVQLLAFMAEWESDKIGERVSSAYKARRLAGKQAGGGIPFFCDIEGARNGKKRGNGGRLVFKPWAIDVMQKIVQIKDDNKITFEMIGKHHGIYDYLGKHMRVPLEDRRHAAGVVSKLYWFYKAWEAAGKPDVNTIKVIEMVRAYKQTHDRKGPQDGDDAEGGEAADQD